MTFYLFNLEPITDSMTDLMTNTMTDPIINTMTDHNYEIKAVSHSCDVLVLVWTMWLIYFMATLCHLY